MTSALSPEQAELNSLITQNIALSNAMNVGESKQSSLLWPSKLVLDSTKSKTTLSTPPTRARLITINGSKLHTYTKKEAPYPLSYSQSVLDSDICDQITLRKLCSNGLTLHDFGDSPPSSVLDIGTGSGNWILEAASTWKDTKKLVGFDLVEIQPIVSHDGPFSHFNDRVTWVQGNMLGDLPFADASFDFVRICRIALGIPENKWNHVLEEVSRVLKPGGIAEVIEEDILFPFAPSQEYNYVADVNCSSPSPSVSVHGDPESSGSSGIDHAITSVPLLSSRRPLSIIVTKSLNPRTRSRSLGANHGQVAQAVVNATMKTAIPPVPAYPLQHAPTTLPTSSSLEAERLGLPLRDPRDHSILFSAWHAMLDDRFISSKPTSHLSFYLPLHFQSVLSHEPIQILAPPPSYSLLKQLGVGQLFEEESYNVQLVSMVAAPSSKSQSRAHAIRTDASMHLRRVLQVVLGCTEAIWEQVKKVNPNLPRETFQYLLRDFELDMLDRINTNAALRSSIGWNPFMGTSDLSKWRERISHFPRDREEIPFVCRNIRGFVAIKASD